MRKLILQIVFIIMIGITIYAIPVHADDERTSFGSEFYQWELDMESPIGIYAHATQGIQTVDVYVQYDATMLAYVSGGEHIEPGRVRISGNTGQQIQYQQMLNFRPLVAGETQITIQESSITDSNGETHISQSISVPIQIALPASWQLTQLQVDGVAIENFTPTILLYNIEVDTDVESIEIEAFPNDLQVEVSSNTLDIGSNTLYVMVTNDTGEQVRYTLEVVRTESENAISSEEITTQGVQVMMQGTHNDGIAVRNQTLMYVLLIILLILLVILIITKIRMSKSARKKEHYQNQNKDIRIIDWSEDLDENMVIEVNHVSMDFKREKDEATSIKEHVIRTVKGQHSYEIFRALDDISFGINKGEVVGIIGTNGSGKSTILKIISGVLAPTSGSVKVDTSKIQLLTLGTGFDMELTGRENIYLNGALIGYTKEYINEKYDEIVKFAELEGFMEEKVRNYSSGMVSRLGFAIATARNTPEILILDEVLSVGDMFFRKKSVKRIMEMIHGGSTVIIVSHSPGTIRENCTKAVWIEQSKLKAVGAPIDVCSAYEKMHSS